MRENLYVLFFLFLLQNENRALRLRNNIDPTIDVNVRTAAYNLGFSSSSNSKNSIFETSSLHSMRHNRYYFDEDSYIRRGSLLPGEDPYIRNRFNQQESDKLASNRAIPDTRHPT